MDPLLRTIEMQDWITLVILISLVFITVTKGLFYSRFLNFIILPFNNKYVFMYNKKDILLNWFNIFLTIFQLMNFALFMYYAKMILSASEKTDQIVLYLFFLGLLSFFLLVKILLQLGNGYVFNAHKTVTELIFKKISYLNHSGIVMFVANIVLSYAVKDSLAVVFLSLLLILLINVAGWATVLRNHQKFIMSNFFYFILYLCALEIAPLVIIGSYLKD